MADMTLRDFFAAQALVGFLSDGGQRLIAEAIDDAERRNLIQDAIAMTAIVNAEVAISCYALADAMLAQRENPHA